MLIKHMSVLVCNSKPGTYSPTDTTFTSRKDVGIQVEIVVKRDMTLSMAMSIHEEQSTVNGCTSQNSVKQVTMVTGANISE